MKALAWEDKDGKVWLTYNASKLLNQRHGVPENLVIKIQPVEAPLEAMVKWARSKISLLDEAIPMKAIWLHQNFPPSGYV
jgi:hypothetical protein